MLKEPAGNLQKRVMLMQHVEDQFVVKMKSKQDYVTKVARQDMILLDQSAGIRKRLTNRGKHVVLDGLRMMQRVVW